MSSRLAYHLMCAPPANASARSEPKVTAKRLASFTVPPPRAISRRVSVQSFSRDSPKWPSADPPSGGCRLSMRGTPEGRQAARLSYGECCKADGRLGQLVQVIQTDGNSRQYVCTPEVRRRSRLGRLTQVRQTEESFLRGRSKGWS